MALGATNILSSCTMAFGFNTDGAQTYGDSSKCSADGGRSGSPPPNPTSFSSSTTAAGQTQELHPPRASSNTVTQQHKGIADLQPPNINTRKGSKVPHGGESRGIKIHDEPLALGDAGRSGSVRQNAVDSPSPRVSAYRKIKQRSPRTSNDVPTRRNEDTVHPANASRPSAYGRFREKLKFKHVTSGVGDRPSVVCHDNKSAGVEMHESSASMDAGGQSGSSRPSSTGSPSVGGSEDEGIEGPHPTETANVAGPNKEDTTDPSHPSNVSPCIPFPGSHASESLGVGMNDVPPDSSYASACCSPRSDPTDLPSPRVYGAEEPHLHGTSDSKGSRRLEAVAHPDSLNTLVSEQPGVLHGIESPSTGTHGESSEPPDTCAQDGSTPPGPIDSTVSELAAKFTDDGTSNIVIFGETGAGKSSIINLIADQERAHTSNGARGCTFHYKRYSIPLDNTSCTLWDTAGLDEGTEGTVAAKEAESNLKDLMQKLAHSGGINLVIYCIRGSRLTRALKRNYDLFYVTVCRKKVHVALVVTGLEHQQDRMETWWTENGPELQRHGMQFDAHACVTSISAEDQIFPERRSESRGVLLQLLNEYSGRPGWKSDPSLVSRILPSFRNLVSATKGNTATVRQVIFCGPFAECFPGTPAILERSTGQIGDGQYQIIRVEKRALDEVSSMMLEDLGAVDAAVLVFYASPEGNHLLSDHDINALQAFCNVAGGRFRPVIVVLCGCEDESAAQECTGKVASRFSDVHAEFVPSPFPSTPAAQAKLEEMIERKCIEQFASKPKHLRRAFGNK